MDHFKRLPFGLLHSPITFTYVEDRIAQNMISLALLQQRKADNSLCFSGYYFRDISHEVLYKRLQVTL